MPDPEKPPWWKEQLDRMSVPETPDDTADSDTKNELNDVRQHPVVATIMIVVGSIGTLLILASSALCWYVAAVERALGEPQNSSSETGAAAVKALEGLGQVQDLFCGLGIELFASAAMLFFFVHLSNSRKQAPKTNTLLYCVVAIGIACCVLPLMFSVTFVSSTFESLGIEVMGAIIVFALLDNVLELIRDKGSE
jgi:hypothetical protein